MRKAALLLVATALLASCGKRGDLAYAPGEKTPPVPLGAAESPSPADMLKPPTEAAPTRVDDPVSKSSVRQTDRFDLPPPK